MHDEGGRSKAAITRRAAAALIFASALLLPRPAMAQEAAGGGALSVASWNLDTARKAGVVREPKAATRIWRHTFGAERRGPEKVALDARVLDADVVLLQGVTKIAEARRLLPARTWKLVASRQLAERPAADAGTGPTLATAVAVRYRRGLRVTSQQHLGELVAPPVLSQSDATAAGAAGTAVRVLADGKAMWLVSVSLAATCQKAATLCPTRDKLEDWIAARRQAGEAVVVGGRGGATVPGAETLGACGEQAIARYAPPAGASPATPTPTAEVNEADGCLVKVELPKS
ncbi:MAG: hypothetical protein AB1749_13780 [Pseudomonadota bacterium]